MNALEILDKLKNQSRLVSAVVISGGEPALQVNLLPFLEAIKKMGLKTKLDTNGTKPQVLKEALRLRLLDYVAMDIKAPLPLYEEVVRRKVEVSAVAESIKLLKQQRVDFEFRTTVYNGLTMTAFLEMLKLVRGAPRWFLQPCRNTGGKVFLRSAQQARLMCKKALESGQACQVRGADKNKKTRR